MTAANRPNYHRPTLAWIKRRARRLQSAYGISRRFAIFDAWTDYIGFTGIDQPRLIALKGGRA